MAFQLRTLNNVFSAKKLKVELARGKGYQYFIYDDGVHYDTRSVMVYKLNDLSLSEWITEGEAFAKDMKKIADGIKERYK